MGKGFVSDTMMIGRVSSKGQITDLSTAFSLDGNIPFSLFIIEKTVQSTQPVLVDCTLYQDDTNANCPFTPNVWDVPAVVEVSINGIDLTAYDVYWVAGVDVDES